MTTVVVQEAVERGTQSEIDERLVVPPPRAERSARRSSSLIGIRRNFGLQESEFAALQ